MIHSMELSLYPLGTVEIGKTIEAFVAKLMEQNITVETGAMSTIITGTTEELFTAVEQAYRTVAATESVVLVTKISNACPV